MNRRVLVTGVGVVSAAGIGRGPFWRALAAGVHPGARRSAPVEGYEPAAILGAKGLRLLDRTALLALGAARLALDDGKFALEGADCGRVGVVLSSTCGSPHSRSAFYLEALEHGFRGLNPALFANTVVNAAASQVAIRFGLTGPNATLATGFTGGLEALEYAADLIVSGRADAVLAGGVEELCPLGLSAWEKSGLTPAKADPSVPFDRRRSGAVPGEGAAVLLLEAAERVEERRAYAEYRGGASALDFDADYRYSLRGAGVRKALRRTLERAGVAPEDIGCVAAGANGSLVGDAAEARGLEAVLGGRVVATASKALTGETFSAGAALQAVAALLPLVEGVIPPTAGHERPDERCPVDCVPGQARPGRVDHVLVSACGPMCRASACVLSRPDAAA